jgi:small subunit ribosomal protein S20
MSQRKSAKKELKKSLKRHERNLEVKQQIKIVIKKFKKSLENKDIESARTNLKEVFKVLDKSASKRVIHPNKAARKKSHLSKLFNQLNPQTSSPTPQ